jgi:cytidylate kinase
VSEQGGQGLIITIGGLPGSGKSTVSKLIAEQLKIDYMNAGDIFRSLANKKGLTLEEFGIYAEQNPNVDQAIDKKVVEVAKKGDVILEGRLAGIMLSQNGIGSKKIWLDAPLKIRAERIAKREDKPIETVLGEVQERERNEWDRYFNLYNIDLNDLSIYDMIIDSAPITAEEVAEQIVKGVQ